jgi:hypothetical protein
MVLKTRCTQVDTAKEEKYSENAPGGEQSKKRVGM